MKSKIFGTLMVVSTIVLAGCDTGNNNWEDIWGNLPEGPIGGGGATNDGTAPDFDSSITAWNGQKATDAGSDVVGDNKDFFYELNTWKNTVTITFDGTSATVSSSNDAILYDVSGAYVTIDMATNTVDKTQIVVSGSSNDGALKVYGASKYMLTLNGVKLTSQKGPAFNSQCKKRIYVQLNEGTENYFCDASSYTDDTYYLDATTAVDEDRKGAFFSEGHLIMSGTGVLQVKGNKKHGICTDGYMYVRPGVTIVVDDAAKNAIHVKGDEDDNMGVQINGGLIYANSSGKAGKGIKCDRQVEVNGGILQLNTSGEAYYDSDENDTSSGAGIKTDTDVYINGGNLTLKATGTGGKGINCDGKLFITGGETTVTTTGKKYTYSSTLTSSPKGVKADGDIEISAGILNICVTGVSESSEGLESKSNLTISGGDVYVWAYEDAINSGNDFTVTGGNVYAYSSANDGIDSNGGITISGGLVIGIGGSQPEGGIDCDNSSKFLINGGTVISMGGSLQSSPSTSSKQRVVVCNGITAAKDITLAVLDSNGKNVLAFTLPRTLSSGNFSFSCAELASSSTYTLSGAGKLADPATSWNGFMTGGTWTDGTTLTTFTPTSIITTIGGSSGPGGGPGMGGHGW